MTVDPSRLAALAPAPGCEVYTDPEKHRIVENSVGGILLETVDLVDADSGELVRRFKVWDPTILGGGGYRTVAESDCGPDSVAPMDPTRTVFATTQLVQRYVKNRGKSGRVRLDRDDVDLIRHTWTLIRALIGGER